MPVSRCPVCEASVHLQEPDGVAPATIGKHRDRRFDDLGKCPASGQTISEALESMAGRREER